MRENDLRQERTGTQKKEMMVGIHQLYSFNLCLSPAAFPPFASLVASAFSLQPSAFNLRPSALLSIQ